MHGQVLWASGDDKGPYHVECVRSDDRHAMLRLLDADGSLLKEQRVLLAFGARFGPDVADVHDWNMLATKWANEHDARLLEYKTYREGILDPRD